MAQIITPAGMPPAFVLSLGLHLVVIFGFFISPAGDSAVQVANRAVTVLLAPTQQAPKHALSDAAAHQQGSDPERLSDAPPSRPSELPTLTTTSASINAQQTGLIMAAHAARPARPTVAAQAALDAEYLRQWQSGIERFGNAYYRGLALRHGDGDVRLRVTVRADGRLLRIDLLSSSGTDALDRAAIDTVEKLAPFAPFPAGLASAKQELAIVRTWQFRR
jgi:protein TonB